jgi:protein YibB
MNSSITIVTAFFDIGRGEWTVNNGFRPKLARTSEVYFSYFKYLAELENDMVVFTSSDLKPHVEAIREGKPTKIITLDIKRKFKGIRRKIDAIQRDDAFKNKVVPNQLKNPEYWSPEYVLVCNLKTYFVKTAIDSGLISTPMVSWIDFGYCRDKKTTDGLKVWDYPFERSKIHFFTIKKGLSIRSLEHTFEFMMSNQVYIIGGAIVGSQEKWLEFYQLVSECQKTTLERNLVDDDQGVFIMSYYKRPDLFRLNYLGRGKWFDLFKCFRRTVFGARMHALKIKLLGK